MASDALAGLPPWLQGLATITVAVAVGGGSLIAYLRPKKEPASDTPTTGALIAQAFASQNDIAKTLESMKRLEGFAEQQLDLTEKIEEGQRERWHARELTLAGIRNALDRIGDNTRR